MICLLCPTRARPEQCRRMIESIELTASDMIYVCLAFSEEDAVDYDIPIGKLSRHVSISHYIMPDCPTAFKWNYMAEHQMQKKEHDIFMLAADDMIFITPGWDNALTKHYQSLQGNRSHVYSLRDSRDSIGTPHPIVTKEYIDAMGYFLPPIFLHWYVDTWTVEIAKANHCFTHLTDYMLLHDKPNDIGEADETHNRLRRLGWIDRDKWVNDHCQHFLALEKSRLKMKVYV